MDIYRELEKRRRALPAVAGRILISCVVGLTMWALHPLLGVVGFFATWRISE